MVGHGGSSAGSYLADPTSPIPSHCASIVATSTLRLRMWFKQNTVQNLISHPKAFTDSCHLLQFCHPPDVVGDVARDEGNKAPNLLKCVCLHSLLDDVVPYWRQVVPSFISAEAWVEGSNVYMASFTFFQTMWTLVKISVLSNFLE